MANKTFLSAFLLLSVSAFAQTDPVVEESIALDPYDNEVLWDETMSATGIKVPESIPNPDGKFQVYLGSQTNGQTVSASSLRKEDGALTIDLSAEGGNYENPATVGFGWYWTTDKAPVDIDLKRGVIITYSYTGTGFIDFALGTSEDELDPANSTNPKVEDQVRMRHFNNKDTVIAHMGYFGGLATEDGAVSESIDESLHKNRAIKFRLSTRNSKKNADGTYGQVAGTLKIYKIEWMECRPAIKNVSTIGNGSSECRLYNRDKGELRATCDTIYDGSMLEKSILYYTGSTEPLQTVTKFSDCGIYNDITTKCASFKVDSTQCIYYDIANYTKRLQYGLSTYTSSNKHCNVKFITEGDTVTQAPWGNEVTVKITPHKGYENPTISSTRNIDTPIDSIEPGLYTFTMPTQSVSVYCNSTPRQLTISYDLNGGTQNDSNVTTFTVEKSETLYNPTRTGYSFMGWYVDSKRITSTLAVYDDITLYAMWEINEHSLVYKLNNKTYDSTKVEYNTELTLLEDPKVVAGQVFSGWSELPATMPDSDVVITGTIDTVTYKILVSVNDTAMGSVTGTKDKDLYEYQGEFTFKAVAKTGYAFVDWSDGLNTAERTIKATADTAYTANFKKLSSSSAAVSSSSKGSEAKSSSSAAASSSSKGSSSNAAAPSSSAAESSSSEKAVSSSSEEETTGLVFANTRDFSININGRNIHISGATGGITIFDMQGNAIAKAKSSDFEQTMPRAGSYVIRVGNKASLVKVK